MTLRRAALRVGAILLALFATASPTAALPTPAEEEARIALIDRVSRSVVHVRAEGEPPSPPPANDKRKKSQPIEDFFSSLKYPPSPRRQEGSGFVVDRARGLILTAAHIAAEAKTIRVTLPGGAERPAELAGLDVEGGLALLRVAGLNLPELELTQRPLRTGESALVVGWMIPLKTVMPIEGMVMGPAPALSMEAAAPAFADYVAVSSVLPNGGFGGSPVVDREGAVIGMVSAIYGRTYGSDALTMMIGSASIRPIVDQLTQNGTVRRGQIGITVDCASQPCTIDSVDDAGPAHLAGIRAGDALLAVDGLVARTESQVRRAIAAKPVGSSVALTIWREGRQLIIPATTSLRVSGRN